MESSGLSQSAIRNRKSAIRNRQSEITWFIFRQRAMRPVPASAEPWTRLPTSSSPTSAWGAVCPWPGSRTGASAMAAGRRSWRFASVRPGARRAGFHTSSGGREGAISAASASFALPLIPEHAPLDFTAWNCAGQCTRSSFRGAGILSVCLPRSSALPFTTPGLAATPTSSSLFLSTRREPGRAVSINRRCLQSTYPGFWAYPGAPTFYCGCATPYPK